ncbi:MAG: hypothetical protein QXT72_03665, partial [Candidatus Micrarchaeia archaeon]
VNKLYGSGEYGLVAEASGIVLLERNYTGPMKFYYPSNAYYSANQLYVWPDGYRNNNLVLVPNYTNKNDQWNLGFGETFISLFPICFNVSFVI